MSHYTAYVDGRACHNCGMEPYQHGCPPLTPDNHKPGHAADWDEAGNTYRCKFCHQPIIRCPAPDYWKHDRAALTETERGDEPYNTAGGHDDWNL